MSTRSFVMKLSLLVASFALVLSLILSSAHSYAWFVGHWEGERELSFTASRGDDPGFYAWVFDVTNESSGETLLKTGAWRNVAVSGTGANRTCEIQKLADRGVANQEKYQFTSLHLGTVDNLISLNNDNYFYMRLDVDNVVRQGRRLRLGYSLPSSGVHFFDLEGADQTSQLTAVQLGDFADLVIVEYAVSASRFDPATNAADQASIDALFSSSNTSGYGLLTSGAALTEVFSADQTSAYTIYFRIHPDLDICFAVTDTLGPYMPCEIVYDFDLTLDFYQIHV